MATLSFLDACAALMATVVVAQALTLGAIQCLRLQDTATRDAAADAEAHRQGLPLPAAVTPAGIWLLLTLLLAAVVAVGDLVEHLGLSLLGHWLSPFTSAALLLVGPAMWSYAVAITRLPFESPPTWRRFARHALPAGLMATGVAVAVVLDPWNSGPELEQRTWTEVLVLVPVAAQILLYLGAVIWRVRQQRPRLEERFSRVQHRQLRWLEAGAWTFALLVLVWMASWTLPVAVSNILTNGLLAVDVALLGIFGARQRNVFAASPWGGEEPCSPPVAQKGRGAAADEAQAAPSAADVARGTGAAAAAGTPGAKAGVEPSAEPGAEIHAAKYAKSAIPALLAGEIADRLAHHVELDKPYLECDLTLGELADAVQATPHQLSQVLSTRLGLSFFDYINGLRVEAVKATLARPQSVGRPLLEIALECGFGSKSAFNEAFKRATGMSPSMYRRSLPASAVALQVLERDAPAALRGVPVQQST